MTTLPSQPATDDSPPDADSREEPYIPDVSVLEDRMPEWFRSTWIFSACAFIVTFVFLMMSFTKLSPSDLWGHLSYGRHLSEHGLQSLHGEDPILPLSSGIEFIDTAWLSQCIGYEAQSALGLSALQFLFAVSIAACVALLLWRFAARTQNFVLCVLGASLFLWVDWEQIKIIRPQLAGLVCFVALFVTLTSFKWRAANWIAIPLLFTLWANLHGSFAVGLVMLATFAVGRAIDLLRRTRNFGSLLHCRQLRRYVLLTELCAAAVLINPYGLQLYSEVLTFAGNENLYSLIEWDPLTFRMRQGKAVAVAALLLIVLVRVSPRRVTATETLLLLGFGGLTLMYSRFLTWWAPLAAYYFVIHANAFWNQFWQSSEPEEIAERKSLWTVVGLILPMIAFFVTNFGLRVRHGVEPAIQRITAPGTPVLAAEYLNRHVEDNTLPDGIVFNSFSFGDYLVWATENKVKFFASSHVHRIPEIVWSHYRNVMSLASGYRGLLDRYSINVLVVDIQGHADFYDSVKRDVETWNLRYEDDQAAVFFRRSPI